MFKYAYTLSHCFIQNCCCITLQVSHQGRKLMTKMEGKTNFPGAYSWHQDPGLLNVWKSLT